MKVYKFGGASVKDANAVKNVAKILSSEEKSEIVVVVSAMDKTTNLLEKICESYFNHHPDTEVYFQQLKDFHFNIAKELFIDENDGVFDQLNNFFVEVEWMLEEEPQDDYNFVYDQIVSIGELLSSSILSSYLNKVEVVNQFLDVRSCIITDNTYREGLVNWEKTCFLINKNVLPILSNQIIVTQGFLGCTTENFTTTLGREGSDYTAAIFGNCLDVKSVSIWKDVAGVLNADPKLFSDTVKFDEIPYSEAIEMSYYGASVIHPKTLKPLQNKNIPLFVRPFNQPNESGTKICLSTAKINIPVIIIKSNQILLSIATNNVAYISENHLKDIFELFAKFQIKMNTMQVSALTFTICFDDDERKFQRLFHSLKENFKVKYNRKLQLITVRHFTKETIQSLCSNKKVLLEQISRNTAQIVTEYA